MGSITPHNISFTFSHKLLIMNFRGFINYTVNNKNHKHAFKLDVATHEFEGVQVKVRQEFEHYQHGRISISLHPSQKITLQSLQIQSRFIFKNEQRLFCNGYQSWTDTDEYEINTTFLPLKKTSANLIKAFGDYDFIAYNGKKGYLHAWTYSYIRLKKDADDIILVGSLNEKKGYTIIDFQTPQNALIVHKDCKDLNIEAGQNYPILDVWIQGGKEQAVLHNYFQLWRKSQPSINKIQALKPGNETGWTSWYYYYNKISENIISDNLRALAKERVPLNIFQIDDGWQHTVGDWLVSNKKFPRGMSFLTQQIHRHKYKAGLWLAPLICEKKSLIYRNNPEWLMKDENGDPIKASYNAVWRSWMYPLNFYLPQVQAYLRRVFYYVLKVWNFDMVKLDFLYAVATQALPNKTRSEIMHDAMDFLRELVGDKMVLGCGVPLAPAFGKVDYCRIGPDVHLEWEMNLLKWTGSRERVSTINALKNAIHRRHQNGQVFFNDPDVSILRLNKNKLSKTQQFTLFLINQIFGSLQFVSDNIAEYSPNTLHLYLSQFPFKGKVIHQCHSHNNLYRIQFSIGNLNYVAYCNLSETYQDIRLAADANFAAKQYGYDKNKVRFFQHQTHQFYQPQQGLTINPFQSICFVVSGGKAAVEIAGSTGHLFPGSEVYQLFLDKNRNLKCQIDVHQRNMTKVFVRINDAKKVKLPPSLVPKHLSGITFVVLNR